MMLLKNTYNEIIKIVAKPRSYLGVAVITVLVAVIIFAMKMEGDKYFGMFTESFGKTLQFNGKVMNGNLVAYLILQMLIIHIPLLIALVTGDLVSGEAALGSMRLLASKPISRNSILISKFIAGAVYSLIVLLWLGFLALVPARIIFGTGDLLVLQSEGIVIFPQDDVLWRFLSGFGIAYLALLTVAALSLTFSCFSNNSIGPIVSTMGVIIIFTIIGTMDVAVFDPIKPFLFTTHMTAWRSYFELPVPHDFIREAALILTAHIVILLVISGIKLNRKDILS